MLHLGLVYRFGSGSIQDWCEVGLDFANGCLKLLRVDLGDLGLGQDLRRVL